MRRISTLSLGLIAAAAVLGAPEAHADRRNPLEGQPAIRRKLELRKLRFEITPQLMVSLNQDFRHFIGGGLVLNFHINDWLGIGLQAAGGGALDTGLTSAINNKLLEETNPNFVSKPIPFQPSREQFNAHLASTNLIASLFAQITPMAGKLAIFGSGYARYDLYVLVGFGLMNLTNTWASYTPKAATSGGNPQVKDAQGCGDAKASTDPNLCNPQNAGLKASGMWGVGMHLYFNEWIGLNLEMRGFVTSANYGGLDVNGDRTIDSKNDATVVNSMFAGAGVTFMLPVHARISP